MNTHTFVMRFSLPKVKVLHSPDLSNNRLVIRVVDEDVVLHPQVIRPVASFGLVVTDTSILKGEKYTGLDYIIELNNPLNLVKGPCQLSRKE